MAVETIEDAASVAAELGEALGQDRDENVRDLIAGNRSELSMDATMEDEAAVMESAPAGSDASTSEDEDKQQVKESPESEPRVLSDGDRSVDVAAVPPSQLRDGERSSVDETTLRSALGGVNDATDPRITHLQSEVAHLWA